jgi:hypothetical protein
MMSVRKFLLSLSLSLSLPTGPRKRENGGTPPRVAHRGYEDEPVAIVQATLNLGPHRYALARNADLVPRLEILDNCAAVGERRRQCAFGGKQLRERR